ncbi:type II toxin-antitoxin system VapC family toxin [Phormidesmis sp. 146-35]
MTYLLDTNVCIVYLNQTDSNVRRKMGEVPRSQVFVCSVVKAELFYGAMRSNNPERTLARQREFLNALVSLPFDDFAATTFGVVRAQLESLGTPIGAYDLQIASIALANNLTLVTHNIGEFSRVEGLKLEDWEVESDL